MPFGKILVSQNVHFKAIPFIYNVIEVFLRLISISFVAKKYLSKSHYLPKGYSLYLKVTGYIFMASIYYIDGWQKINSTTYHCSSVHLRTNKNRDKP